VTFNVRYDICNRLSKWEWYCTSKITGACIWKRNRCWPRL